MNLKPIVALAASLAAVIEIDAHGGLVIPPCRNNHGNVNILSKATGDHWEWATGGGSCAGDMCLWFNDGCFIGCPNCSSTVCTGLGICDRVVKPNCEKPALMEPTLPEELRSWNIGNPSAYGDWTKHHPWRAPGYAPVSDPCGRAGANTALSGGGEVPTGAKRFDRGSLLPKLDVVTTWHSGQPAEVGWMVGSNHGGGYIYSLCPANETLTEACFQKITLAFVGDFHVIRRLDNTSLPEPEYTIPAMQTSEGTFPVGSMWRRNPIPACNCNSGKGCGVNKTMPSLPGYPLWYKAYADEAQPEPVGGSEPCPTGTQFPVPCPQCYGQAPFGARQSNNMWAIVDEVQVPNVTGDFVLRWRWDTEQVPQIWTHCADVTIV